jgi:hypothetical protein
MQGEITLLAVCEHAYSKWAYRIFLPRKTKTEEWCRAEKGRLPANTEQAHMTAVQLVVTPLATSPMSECVDTFMRSYP